MSCDDKLGIKCAYCKSTNNTVADSRPVDYCVIRVRKCFNCGRRFTTREEISDKKRDTVAIKAMPDWARKNCERSKSYGKG